MKPVGKETWIYTTSFGREVVVITTYYDGGGDLLHIYDTDVYEQMALDGGDPNE